MPDGQLLLYTSEADDARLPEPIAYAPPMALILHGLGTNEIEMKHARVSVSAPFLRFLLGEMARPLPFDAAFYAHANPDVEAARLAGDVATLHDHFIAQGYFEQRQPHDLPFDHSYYANHYDDLARAFGPNDGEALRRHYNSHGWQEGRVGVSWQRADADRWVAAVRDQGG